MQMHLIKSPLHIVCVDCFKQFKSNGGLEGHRRQVSWPSFLPIYHGGRDIINIIKQMHRNSQKLHCPGCGAVFLNASGITQHVEGNGCQAGLNKAVLSRKIIHSNDPTASLDIDPRRKPNTTTTHIWRDGIIPPELKKHVNNSYSLQFPEDDAARLRRDARATARKTEPVMPDWHNNQVNPAASVKSDSTERTTLNRNKPSVLDYTDGIGAFEDENEPTLHDMGRYWAAKERHFLCPYNQCRKRFFNANAILQHMLSSTHARKVFRLVAPSHTIAEVLVLMCLAALLAATATDLHLPCCSIWSLAAAVSAKPPMLSTSPTA